MRLEEDSLVQCLAKECSMRVVSAPVGGEVMVLGKGRRETEKGASICGIPTTCQESNQELDLL